MVCAQEECAVVRQGGREYDDLGLAVAEVHHGRIEGRQVRSSDTEAGGVDEESDSQSHARGRSRLRSVSGEWNDAGGSGIDQAVVLRSGTRSQVRGRDRNAVAESDGEGS